MSVKQRPDTEGCTEWSCMYHGGNNRFKAAHDRSCPIFQYSGDVMAGLDAAGYLGPVCKCPSTEPAPEGDYDARVG